jgi:hypothetical protein
MGEGGRGKGELSKAELHRAEFAFEGVEDQAEHFEREYSQQRFVVRFA